MTYIDPKKPRYVGNRARAERTRQVARQIAQEARREKLRLLVHGVIILLGIWSFKNTDLDSPEPFLSVTLPLMDIVFCVYLLLLLFIEIWRRGNR